MLKLLGFTVLFTLSLTRIAFCSDWEIEQYEGKLVSGQIPSQIKQNPRELFKIEIVPSSNDQKEILFKNIHGRTFFRFDISGFQKKWYHHLSSRIDAFSAEFPTIRNSIQMTRARKFSHPVYTSSCYVDAMNDLVSVCLGDRDFYLSMKDDQRKTLFEVRGGVFGREKFEFEEPQHFTVTQVIDRALKKSFQSLIEYQHMVQASMTAWSSKANLLPHFRYPGAVATYYNALPALPNSFGDWFPFFFANRYALMVKDDFQAKAEKIAYSIKQSNLAAQVHRLSYTYLHDKSRLFKLIQLQKEVKGAQEKAQSLWKKHLLGSHVLGSLVLVQKTLDTEIRKRQSTVSADQAVLSESLGFLNPKAVADIEGNERIPDIHVKPEIPVDQNPADEGHMAYSISLEKRQLEYLQKALVAKRIEHAFNWMDPNGNPMTGAGVNMVPQQISMKSEKIEILEKQDELKAKIEQAADAISRQEKSTHETFELNEIAYNQQLTEIQKNWDFLNSTHRRSRNEVAISLLAKYYEKLVPLILEQEDLLEKWDQIYVRRQRLFYLDLYHQINAEAEQETEKHKHRLRLL